MGVLGNPRRAAEISKVNFGSKKTLEKLILVTNAGFLVFYKSGFSFSRPKPAWAMAGAGQQTAVGDSTGGPQAAKPILFG